MRALPFGALRLVPATSDGPLADARCPDDLEGAVRRSGAQSIRVERLSLRRRTAWQENDPPRGAARSAGPAAGCDRGRSDRRSRLQFPRPVVPRQPPRLSLPVADQLVRAAAAVGHLTLIRVT